MLHFLPDERNAFTVRTSFVIATTCSDIILPARVQRRSQMTQEQKIIKNKLGLLKLAQTLGSVSEACKVLGFSRDSF